MAGKGGASPRRKGDILVKVVKDQQAPGRSAYRVRCPSTWQHDCQGAIVVAVERCEDGGCSLYGDRVAHVYMILVKVTGKLPAAEREALIAEADKVGGLPLLAWPENGTVRYEQLGPQQAGGG